MKYHNISELEQTFKALAFKTISQTDIEKGAYVVPLQQKQILDQAGVRPGVYPNVARFKLHFLGTEQAIEAS